MSARELVTQGSGTQIVHVHLPGFLRQPTRAAARELGLRPTTLVRRVVRETLQADVAAPPRLRLRGGLTAAEILPELARLLEIVEPDGRYRPAQLEAARRLGLRGRGEVWGMDLLSAVVKGLRDRAGDSSGQTAIAERARIPVHLRTGPRPSRARTRDAWQVRLTLPTALRGDFDELRETLGWTSAGLVALMLTGALGFPVGVLEARWRISVANARLDMERPLISLRRAAALPLRLEASYLEMELAHLLAVRRDLLRAWRMRGVLAAISADRHVLILGRHILAVLLHQGLAYLEALSPLKAVPRLRPLR